MPGRRRRTNLEDVLGEDDAIRSRRSTACPAVVLRTRQASSVPTSGLSRRCTSATSRPRRPWTRHGPTSSPTPVHSPWPTTPPRATAAPPHPHPHPHPSVPPPSPPPTAPPPRPLPTHRRHP